MTLIYKIASRRLWEAAVESGAFLGAGIDETDGYIHFSTAGQVIETVAKHFAGQRDLLLIGVQTEDLGSALKWEPARGGALFPHLYGPLPVAAARTVRPIPMDSAGVHRVQDVLP